MAATRQPYRAAIIGTGRIASRLERDPLRGKPCTHAGHYRACADTALVAGCDIDPDALAAFGADWGIGREHLYPSYLEMLERERPDIVSVCAYAPERVAMCRAAIAAGVRGLWIEKAVACSMEEAHALEREVGERGVAIVVDHPRRLEARYRAVRRWIHDEVLGRLESVHAIFSGCLLHTGTHAWDALIDWCGPWASVTTVLDPAGRDADGRTTAAGGTAFDARDDRGGRAHVGFDSGVEAFVSGASKDYFIFQFDLVFSRGRVRIGNDAWEVLRPSPSPRYTGFEELAAVAPDALVTPDDEHPRSMLGDLVHAMDTGEVPSASLRSAIDALSLGMACMQSGATRQVVTPRSLSPSWRTESR